MGKIKKLMVAVDFPEYSLRDFFRSGMSLALERGLRRRVQADRQRTDARSQTMGKVEKVAEAYDFPEYSPREFFRSGMSLALGRGHRRRVQADRERNDARRARP